MAASCALMPILLLTGCDRAKQQSSTQTSSVRPDLLSATTVLATIGDDERPQSFIPIPGHVMPSASENQQALFQVIFSETGKGAAYLAEEDGKTYVVHNGSAGKQYATVGAVSLSADGRRIAYGALEDGKWRMVSDGKEGEVFNTVKSPVFSPDGKHLAYLAMKGEKWYVVVDDMPNSGTSGNYSNLQFNADSNLIAYVENQAVNKRVRLIISDLRFGSQHVKQSAGNLLVASNDKTRLAATQIVNNKLRVIDFSFAEPEVVNEGQLYDGVDLLAVGDDGASVSYVAVKSTTRFLVLNNREEPLPEGDLPGLPVVRPDKKGAGILMARPNGVFLRQAFFHSTEKGKMYDEAANLVYSPDSRFYALAARKGQGWFIVVNGKEGPGFDRVVSPIFSPDGKKVVYRARKAGKRFVVVADTNGKTIKQHPEYEQVFQPVFSPDGKSVAYGVKDGRKLICEVEKLD